MERLWRHFIQPFRKNFANHVDEVILGKRIMFIIHKIYTLR